MIVNTRVIEKPDLDIGIMPLSDCAPYVIAVEHGLFEKYGLNVTLHKQNSWSTLREKLYAGLLDAAQLLAPMPLAGSLQAAPSDEVLMTPMVISCNGNAITISRELREKIQTSQDGEPLSQPMSARALLAVLKADPSWRITLAAVHPYSCHYYQLLSWLRSFNIPQDRVDIIILPPSQMVSALDKGEIDGFCVSSPWNIKAVRNASASTIAVATDVWPNFPEKVLGMLESWYQVQPNTAHALMMALGEACQWLSNSAHKIEASCLLAEEKYLGLPVDLVSPGLLGSSLLSANSRPRYISNYNEFFSLDRQSDFCPHASYADWLLSQMCLAGQALEKDLLQINVKRAYREDIFIKVWGKMPNGSALMLCFGSENSLFGLETTLNLSK